MQLSEIRDGMQVTLNKGNAKFRAVVLKKVGVEKTGGRKTFYVSVRRMGSKRTELVRPAAILPVDVFWSLEQAKREATRVSRELERQRKALAKAVDPTVIPASVHGDCLCLEIPVSLVEGVVALLSDHLRREPGSGSNGKGEKGSARGAEAKAS